MSLIQTLVNKVIQLNDRLNQIVLNARKIEDLPPQVEADFNSLIHVSRNGISEKLSLSVLQEAVSEGSVKPRLISVAYVGNPTYIELAAALNNRPTINILAGELPLFHFYDARARGEATVPNPSYRFFINKKSPNTYGIGGITIESSNLIFVSETKASVDEIESMQGTQIIDLGEIGTANVWDFLNLKDPIVSIQDATDGYRLVKTLVDGVSVRYLFLGAGGNYGVGGLQSVEGDFDIQSSEIVPSDNSDTIATKIEITFADLGVTTITEVTDLMVKNHINGLGLVKSRKEFYVVNVVEEVSPIEDINFDVEGDWEENGIVDRTSFASYLGADDPSLENFGSSVENFSLLNGRLKAKLGGVSGIYLPDLGITTVHNISNIGLTYFDLSANQIVSFNPNIPLPIGLGQLNLAGNQIVSFNPDIPLPVELTDLDLRTNKIVSFNPNILLPTGLINLDLSDNQISDWSLSEEFANSLQNGSAGINTTDNPTSSAGTTFKSILESKGYTVISD